MPGPEHSMRLNPETFYDDILLWRPPLPVDRADFSDLFDINHDPDVVADTPGYAWERLPRWITQIEDTFKRTSDVPIVCIDLCSSVPLNAQMLRALEFKRSGERSRELVRSLFSDSPLHKLLEPDLRAVHTAATGNGPMRRVLESAVQAILYTRNGYDMAGGDRDEALKRLSERFNEILPGHNVTYSMEQGGRNLETSWGIAFTSAPEDKTYFEGLAELACPTEEALAAAERLRAVNVVFDAELVETDTITDKKERKANRSEIKGHFQKFHKKDIELAHERIPAGEALATRYLEWQIANLAGLIAGNNRYRPARFISLDMAPRAMIANSSLISTSEILQETNLFSHAVNSLFDPHQHLARDMFEPLPVPDNSLAFITCYDAWPFDTSFMYPDAYGSLDPEEIDDCIVLAVDRLYTLYQKLAYGGKLLIFPWATQDNDPASSEILRRVTAKLSTLVGHGISVTLFSTPTLMELMSESEQFVAEQSMIFNDNESYAIDALIVEKPDNPELVQRHAKALGRRLLIAEQIQDSPDPTQ